LKVSSQITHPAEWGASFPVPQGLRGMGWQALHDYIFLVAQEEGEEVIGERLQLPVGSLGLPVIISLSD